MVKVLAIFLTILFIPLSLVLLILVSIRFQFLDPNFWINTFNKYDVYQNLETVIPRIIEWQTVHEGGSNAELAEARVAVKVLTDENLKITFEENIKNTLNFVNGKENTWNVFIPKDKLPKGLLPNFLLDSETVPLDTLISFFRRGQGNGLAFTSEISIIGKVVWTALTFWFVLVLLILFALYKFRGLPLALFTSAFFILLLVGFLTIAKVNIARDLIKEGMEPAQLLLATLGPPIVTEVTNLWVRIAVIMMVLALTATFAMKRRVNVS